MSIGIIVKSYEHFNRSLPNWDSPKGKYIGSRKQYEQELAKGGFVKFEDGEQMAKAANLRQEYKGISPKARKLCEQAKYLADKKGKIKWTTGLVNAMKEIGVGFDYYNKLPAHYEQKGGFAQEG